MSVQWVNYDLNATGQDYSELIKYLKSHQSWAKPAKSSFFVKTDLTAKELRDGIANHVDSNDVVIVVTVTDEWWATRGVTEAVNDWMKRNISA